MRKFTLALALYYHRWTLKAVALRFGWKSTSQSVKSPRNSMAQKPVIPKSRKTVERAKKQAAKGSVKEVKKAVGARGSTLGNIDSLVKSILPRDREKPGARLIASASVSMEGCQRDSIWGRHSRPTSASPLSQPPVFPSLKILGVFA